MAAKSVLIPKSVLEEKHSTELIAIMACAIILFFGAYMIIDNGTPKKHGRLSSDIIGSVLTLLFLTSHFRN